MCEVLCVHITLQEEKFSQISTLMALGVCQGGSGFSFFATSLYSFFCGHDIFSIDVPDEQIPDHGIRILVQQVFTFI